MPVVESAIPQVEVDALTVRRAPLFGTTNALRAWNRAPVFSTSGLWSSSGTYITDANYPTTALRDGHAIVTSRPTSVNGLATFYLLFDLTAGVGSGLNGDPQNIIDMFAILNHNLHLIAPSGTTIRFQISPGDQQDFGDQQEIATIGSTFIPQPRGWKAIVANLQTLNGSYRRWEQLQYCRFRFDAIGGNFNTIQPRIGEVVIGRRRQMMWPPVSTNPIGQVMSEVAVFPGETGVDVEYVLSERRAEPQLTFHLARAAASVLAQDEINIANSIWNDTQGGTKNFLYVDDYFNQLPAAHPRGLWVKSADKVFNVNMNSWGDGLWNLNLKEQSPMRGSSETRYPWDM